MILVQQSAQGWEVDHLVNARLSGVKVYVVFQPDHIVGKNLDEPVVHVHNGFIDALAVQFLSPIPGENLPRFGQNFAGAGIGNGLGQLLVGEPGP